MVCISVYLYLCILFFLPYMYIVQYICQSKQLKGLVDGSGGEGGGVEMVPIVIVFV